MVQCGTAWRRLGQALVDRAGFEPAYGKPGQIYSLLPLTTRPPVQRRPYGKGAPLAKEPRAVNVASVGSGPTSRGLPEAAGLVMGARCAAKPDRRRSPRIGP